MSGVTITIDAPTYTNDFGTKLYRAVSSHRDTYGLLYGSTILLNVEGGSPSQLEPGGPLRYHLAFAVTIADLEKPVEGTWEGVASELPLFVTTHLFRRVRDAISDEIRRREHVIRTLKERLDPSPLD